MSIVKTIQVAISATTEKFEAGMKRAVLSFDVLDIATKAYNLTIGQVQEQMAKVGEAMDNIDTASKAAASIGIATDELMRLRFAIGEIAGVSGEQTDAMLTKMIRTIAEGGKPASDALQSMGLSLANLRAMTPEQAFFAITDAISQMEGQGAKAAAAVDIFGKSGASLLPIFSGGAAALRESAQFADQFGLAVNSVDAVAIETANDTLGRLSGIMDGIYNQIAVELAPQIIAFGQTLIFAASQEGGIKSIGDMFAHVGSVVSWVVSKYTELVDVSKSLVSILPDFGGAQTIAGWMGAGGEAAAAASQQKDLTTFAGQYAANLEAAKKQFEEMKIARDAAIGGAGGGAMEAATKEQEQRSKEMQSAAESIQRGMDQVNAEIAKEQADTAAEIQRGMDQVNQEMARRAEQMQSRGDSIREATQTPIERFADRVAELQQLQREGVIDQTTFGRAFADAREQFTSGLGNEMQKTFTAVQGPAAITGGPASTEAFSAFTAAKRGQDMQKEQTEYQKKMEKHLQTMVQRGIVLAAADLGGTPG